MQASQITKSPCKGCPKRQLHCHAECGEYKQYKKDIDEVRDKCKRELAENSFFYDIKGKVHKIGEHKRMMDKKSKLRKG
jgi:hypothetical protein